MKTISIVRHSKAIPYEAGQSDFQRVLAEKGRSKARLIAGTLASQGVACDLMLSSPAARAYETAEIFAQQLSFPRERIITHEALYHFGGYRPVMEMIRSLDQQVQHAMFFGHNPTFTALAWHLSSRFRSELPTCTVVGLELPIDDWDEIQAGEGRILYYLTRRRIEDTGSGRS